MAFECPRRSSPPSPMFDADTGCIATDPAPSARRRFRSKTGIENLPANEHAQKTPHTPSPTRTTRRIQSGCAGSRPRLRDGMPGSPSQHIDITRAKWIPYLPITRPLHTGLPVAATIICYSGRMFDADRRAYPLRSPDSRGQFSAPNNNDRFAGCERGPSHKCLQRPVRSQTMCGNK